MSVRLLDSEERFCLPAVCKVDGVIKTADGVDDEGGFVEFLGKEGRIALFMLACPFPP